MHHHVQLQKYLFSREMKFLHDNHFIVLPISNIRYDENTKYLYVNSPNGT